MTEPDPFDEGVPRNGKGQPTIIPLKRGKPDPAGKLIPFLRASTVADAIDDGGGLSTWQKRHAAIGVAVSPDLAAMIAALGSDLNDYTPQDKRDLDAILDTAHDRSGGNAKANYGTAIHSLTEDPYGIERDRVANDTMARDVASYEAALAALGIEVVTSEVFVVNDEAKVAGTYDHVYRLSRDLTVTIGGNDVVLPAGLLLIGDKKTGHLHLETHAIQLAVYARGKRYDHTTGERFPLDVSPQYGVVAHIARGEGKTALYVVDLHAGWAAAKLAAQVREWHTAANRKAISHMIGEGVVGAPPAVEDATPVVDPFEQAAPPVDTSYTQADDYNEPDPSFADAEAMLHRAGLNPTDPILHAISKTNTVDECHKLWRDNKAAWSQKYSDAVLAKYPKAA